MSVASIVSTLGLRPRRDPRRARRAHPSSLLTPAQIQRLGVLLIAAQLPQALHLPIWVVAFGFALVVLRFVLLRRDRARPLATPARIPSWALALFALAIAFAIRKSYGYFAGRDPCVAFLFVLVGIKFLEVRTLRDGTLLVCLAIFLLVTPFFYSQSMLAAVAALPAVLAVGGALDALATDAGRAPMPSWRASWRRTATMIAQGLPIAAALFLLFPRLASPLWGLPADRAASTGLSERMAPGSISELALNDAVAFRVDFDGPIPAMRSRYWRGPVLSIFNGREWRGFSPVLGGKLGNDGGASVAYTVTLEANDHPWLFALDFPSAMPQIDTDPTARGNVGGFAGYSRDNQLLMRSSVTQTLRYSVQSKLADSFAVASPRDASVNSRPPIGNPRTVEFAQTLRARYPDDRRLISAVLQWFRDEQFYYTLAPPLMEEAPVDTFLFETRRGFCEHFASAFVVILRAAGIPARVVTGYQGGEINPRGNYLIVRQSDAHAWAEAIIDGRWQRFDPTAAVAPSRVDRGLFGSVSANDPVPLFARDDGGWLKNVQLAFDAINHQWHRNVVQFNRDRQRALWRDWRLDEFAPWEIVGGAAAAALAWAGAVLAAFAVRRKRQERTLALWSVVCKRLARAGLPRQGHEGPLAFSERAAARWPQFAIAFRAIGDAFAALRYGSADRRESERLALVATLERAIDVLPTPAKLRAM